ncbi:hypothetical protein VNO77_21762 [Canavalia gladiata]|uniref:Uncharacterized protein n=1 Tax=Canavalia gladiata TaxID=3824 RepID=A0AAN9L1B5_CANGL
MRSYGDLCANSGECMTLIEICKRTLSLIDAQALMEEQYEEEKEAAVESYEHRSTFTAVTCKSRGQGVSEVSPLHGGRTDRLRSSMDTNRISSLLLEQNGGFERKEIGSSQESSSEKFLKGCSEPFSQFTWFPTGLLAIATGRRSFTLSWTCVRAELIQSGSSVLLVEVAEFFPAFCSTLAAVLHRFQKHFER